MTATLARALLPWALTAACAGALPVPTQGMADAESADRNALALGAGSDPAAQLPLKRAEEEIARAKVLIARGDNEGASSLLVRSKADSRLAMALAREQTARLEALRATEESHARDRNSSGPVAVR